MADVLAEAGQLCKVFVRFFEHPVLRTREQVEELKAGGLFVRDAGPDDALPSHVQEAPAADGQPARTVVAAPASTPPAPPAGGPADSGKETK